MNAQTTVMYKLIAWASLIIILAVTIYGAVESSYVTGEPIGKVSVDVYFPYPPYFAQPET